MNEINYEFYKLPCELSFTKENYLVFVMLSWLMNYH